LDINLSMIQRDQCMMPLNRCGIWILCQLAPLPFIMAM
jgi:hypothetical protein